MYCLTVEFLVKIGEDTNALIDDNYNTASVAVSISIFLCKFWDVALKIMSQICTFGDKHHVLLVLQLQ